MAFIRNIKIASIIGLDMVFRVDKESYLLELCRYIVLNPIRVRMIKDAEGWTWSRYLSIIGVSTPPDGLKLSHFGLQRKRVRAKCNGKHYTAVGL